MTAEVLGAEGQLDRLIRRYPRLDACREDINKVFLIMEECFRSGGTLLVCGNGGSGSDSEHIVGELMKEFALRRPLGQDEQAILRETFGKDGEILAGHIQGALPAIPLTGNIALSTAYANDAVPELVFAQEVNGYGKKGSVLLGISTSGNSKNVIYAMEMAKTKEMKTVALLGQGGGEMKRIADAAICVPAAETPEIQELHLPVYHCLCRMLEDTFFGEC